MINFIKPICILEKLKLQSHKLLPNKNHKNPQQEVIKLHTKRNQLNKAPIQEVTLKINLAVILNQKDTQTVTESITTKNAQVSWYTFHSSSEKRNTTTTF